MRICQKYNYLRQYNADMYQSFWGIEDPHTSNTNRHDHHDMLMIGLLTIISVCVGGGSQSLKMVPLGQ